MFPWLQPAKNPEKYLLHCATFRFPKCKTLTPSCRVVRSFCHSPFLFSCYYCLSMAYLTMWKDRIYIRTRHKEIRLLVEISSLSSHQPKIGFPLLSHRNPRPLCKKECSGLYQWGLTLRLWWYSSPTTYADETCLTRKQQSEVVN